MTTPSLNGFITWLKTKDPNEPYVWMDIGICPVAQYLRSISGITNPEKEFDYPNSIGGLYNYSEICGAIPHTYGAALARAERVAQDQVMEYAP